MNLKTLFVNPSKHRLRAGWRLTLQTLILFAIAVGLSLALGGLAFVLPIPLDSLILSQIVELVTITASVYLARRLLDRRSFISLGLALSRQALFDVLAGIGITFLMMGMIYLVEWATGWSTFDGLAWQVESAGTVLLQTWLIFLAFILVSWNEELLSRGYHLQTLASGINLFWGVVLSSAVFGLLHLGNPNATWTSAAGIFLAGVFLAYGYLRTQQLWLSIGLHIGWNFFEGVVFGFPVSGLNTYRLIRHTVDGPVMWTGGAFGPEAGLVLVPALMAGALLIFVYTRGRNVERLNF